jgi:hypothetical protein
MERRDVLARVFAAVAGSALLMSAMAGPAAAQSVQWKNIVGIVQPGNIVGSFATPATCSTTPPIDVGCINGAGQPWTTLGGQADVTLASGQLDFHVNGLVLAVAT